MDINPQDLTLPTAADFIDLAERVRETSFDDDTRGSLARIFGEVSSTLEAAAIHLLIADGDDPSGQLDLLLEGRDDILYGKKRGEFIADLKLKYPAGQEDDIYLVNPQYVLVEQSRLSGGHYLTGHESVSDAISYADDQENPEDWSSIGLFNTDTGDRYVAVTTTNFKQV